MTDYEKQADDFLKLHAITFKAKMTADNKCPMWCDGKDHIHGNKHKVTFTRVPDEDGWIALGTAPRFTLTFWNSYNDARTGAAVRAYDVLTSITKSDPEDFQTFCSEYGYDTDSRKAEQTYKAVVKEWEKVQAFFTEDEITELQEIN